MSAGVYFTIKPGRSNQLATNLVRKIRYAGGHLKIPFTAAGKYLVRRSRESFERERTPDGHVWAALAPATVQRRGSAHPILVVSGKLRDSVSYVASDKALAVGTRVPYGVFHQYGTRRMPARPFLGASREDEDAIHELLIEYMVRL